MSLSVDPTTNRTTRSGFQYDANGNLTNLPNVSGALSYDIENRTGSTNSLYGNLAYDMENQPLDRGGQWNLYGLNGERLGTYTYTFGRNVTYINGVDYDATLVYPARASRNIYFGGRLIQSNNTTVGVDARFGACERIGADVRILSLRRRNGLWNHEWPREVRDVHARIERHRLRKPAVLFKHIGAFTSADPLHQTATSPAAPNTPGTWNRFAYTATDPINRFDSSGTSNCVVDSFDDSDGSDVSLGSLWCGITASGSTRCYSRPGLIFTFKSVTLTCQDSIIVAGKQPENHRLP